MLRPASAPSVLALPQAARCPLHVSDGCCASLHAAPWRVRLLRVCAEGLATELGWLTAPIAASTKHAAQSRRAAPSCVRSRPQVMARSPRGPTPTPTLYARQFAAVNSVTHILGVSAVSRKVTHILSSHRLAPVPAFGQKQTLDA